ncbi:unnamed protein product [Caenorhabditis angaria]|uniref:Rhodanese domain-containing protein n=1 Tax=Caenorhabditis angaria TaxID=860376 RepID=A0A9P1IV22_9PELO|nr:unnamed protein product [Caenorhabditis angaria]
MVSSTTVPIITAQYAVTNAATLKFIDSEFSPSDSPIEHIPGSATFTFDKGFFGSQYIKFDLYDPENFQKYIRLLGVKNSDQIVIYSRGPAAGNMYSSRAFWTLKVYGFENVSVLDGGIDAWKSAGGKTSTDPETFSLGDFDAKPFDKSILINFEEIPFNNLSSINYLDVRTTAQFTGEESLSKMFPGTKATGSHVPGAISFPMGNLISSAGFKSQAEVDQLFNNLKLDKSKLLVVSCNTGIQASVVHTALRRSGVVAKVYNGSMAELAYHAPELVTATGS